MQLLEVSGNIAKILYNPADNHLLPSDFLLIEDKNQKLIAQIINISTTDDQNSNLTDVRFILSIDKDDNLSYYNGYIPLKNSSVVYIHPDEIIELIKSNGDNIYFGNLSNHSDCFVKVPLSCINDRLYIQSDRNDKIKTLIQNISAELISKQQKVIILDFNGNYTPTGNIPQLKIADSFKLPLNIDAFNNILEYDTTDCPIEDKAVIQSIVLELREYIKTIENKFLPFTLFKTVIDNELSANPQISGLMLLRNKLWLYSQEGIFAESKTQFEILSNILANQNIVIIDASSLEEKWYKFAIQTILSLVNQKCYFVLSLNDINADKKTITGLYGNNNIIPIVSTAYSSKYREILKSICKNQILFKPSKEVNDEDAYNSFLNRINSSEFILYGESDLYIPLIVELQAFTSRTKENVSQNDIKKEVDKIFTGKKAIDTTLDDIIRPMSVSDNDIQPAKNNTIDNDFNDDDLDFLEEKDTEKITIEDIKGTKDTNKEEIKYDVFSPYEQNNEKQQTEKSVNVTEIAEKFIENDIEQKTNKDKSTNNTENKDLKLEDIDEIYLSNEEYNQEEKIEENNETLEKVDNIDILAEEEPVSIEEEVINTDKDSEIIPLEDAAEETEPIDIIETENAENIEQSTTANDNSKTETDINNALDDIEILPEDTKEEEPDKIESIDEIIDEIEEKAAKKDNDEIVDSILEEIDQNKETTPDAPKINPDIKRKEKGAQKLTEYDAEIEDNSKAKFPFKVNDKVFHPKNGYGTIVDVIHYGDKMFFCRVYFDQKGERILDPRVSGLEKV